MNEITSHRGPDGTGVFVEKGVSLGHNRLAIIDLSDKGSQPMRSRDGRFIIIYNGEIYNYRELKTELTGYPFQSSSDTEVILAAYEVWGEKAFARLNGMFSFALFDTKEQKLILVRDPVGIKPLYYYWDNQKLIFSSEIKAILEHTDVPRRVDPLALNLYMRVLYVPAPHTMFLGIKKLPSGSMLIHTRGTINILSYVQKPNPILSQKPFGELKEELHTRVKNSVKRQLVSDRPVGLYLSGGVDSSAVLSVMTEAQSRVETFSVGFELTKEEQKEKFNVDSSLAKSTAKHFGATHHEVLMSPSEILPLFEEAIYHLDEPVSNATIIPMLKLARFAKTRVATVLGGDGGDELFGGYERYRWSLLSSYYRRSPNILRKGVGSVLLKLKKLDTASGVERFMKFGFQKEDVVVALLASNVYNADSSRDFFDKQFLSTVSEPFETQFMRTDRQSWLVDESLQRSDKLSMAAGLEGRVPLLDLPLIDFAETIPQKYKLSAFNTKIILREAFKEHLPEGLYNQPKRGWFSPGAKWLRHPEIAKFACEVLSADYNESTKDLFNWDHVRTLLDAHLNGGYHLTELWTILTFQLWARRFKVSR